MKSKTTVRFTVFLLLVLLLKPDSKCLKFFLQKDPSLSEYEFVDLQNSLVLSWNPLLKFYFSNFAVFFPSIGVNQEKGKFYIDLEAWISIMNQKGKEIFSHISPLQLKLSKYQSRLCRSRGCAVSELFPIIPGDFKLSILIKDKISKKFTCFEENLRVPSPSLPSIADIFPSYTPQDFESSKLLKPFVIGGREFKPVPHKNIPTGEAIFLVIHFTGLEGGTFREAKFRIKILEEEKNPFLKTLPLTKSIVSTGLLEIPLELLIKKPGEYSLKIEFIVNNRKTDEKVIKLFKHKVVWKKTYYLSSRKFISKELPDFLRLIARQYFNNQNYRKTIKVLSNLKAFQEGDFILKAKSLLKLHKVDEALLTLNKLKNENFERLLILGEIFEIKGNYEKSEEFYRKALNLRSDSINALNKLGRLLIKTGKTDEGLDLLKRSLILKPDQPDIRSILESYR